MKRALDLFGSGVGLIVLSPVFLVIAILIKLNDFGPVLFGHRRCGQFGRFFRMWKFRSMVVNADRLGSALTVGRDPRITRVGALLRKFKVDELPQLLNVFLGQMSLVGPRPEVELYVALYSPAQSAVLNLKPGITDPASFAFYDEGELLGRAADAEYLYNSYLMPEKIRINLEYAAQAGMGRDLLLILATVGKIFGVRVNVFKILNLTPPRTPP